ncbi:MAG: PDZ domain-containing protein, partial [Clostridia bacterium]|nr:PDZ domain-containing protein [Clostridia bacterium]
MKKLLAMLLSVLCLFSCVAVQAEEPENLSAAYFDMVLSGLFDNYKFEADKEGMLRAIAAKALTENPELLEDFIDIASDHLDEHSVYYTPREVDAFLEAFHAEYVGIGIIVQRMVGAVTVVNVFPGSTAEKAGLVAGDRIMAVDGY